MTTILTYAIAAYGCYAAAKHFSWIPKWTSIVQFGEGEFAIRRGVPPLVMYRDLNSVTYWWTRSSVYFKDCVGSLERCNEVHRFVDGYGTPVE